MDLSALGNVSTASSGAPQAAVKKTVSKDEFLKLFVAQLKNQDPLAPMDGTAFTAQLAQFSSLEQLTNISDGMSSLLLYQNSLQNALVASLIGKQVGFRGKDASGADAMQYGKVTGITFESGQTWLVVDAGTKVKPGDITEIR